MNSLTFDGRQVRAPCLQVWGFRLFPPGLAPLALFPVWSKNSPEVKARSRADKKGWGGGD